MKRQIRKAPDKIHGIEPYTIAHPNFSMSPQLVSESVGKLLRKLCSFVDEDTFATCYSRREQHTKSGDMEKLEQLFSSLTLV